MFLSGKTLVAVYLLILSGSLLIGFLGTEPQRLDDHFLYQEFAEKLSVGKLDLTIPGFHGSDVLVVPVYWLTRSPIAQIYTQVIMTLLLPFLGYVAGRSIYRSREGDSSREGLLLAIVVTLMPFISFVGLRGWNGASYWSLMLGSIALAPSLPLLAGVVLALAALTKPFAIALLPLLLVLTVEKKSETQSRRIALLLGALLPIILYVVIQYFQAGRIFVGAHSDVSPGSAFQGPLRIFLNVAHAFQILFSVHNYYFPNPSLTGPGNMLHTTPVLMFLALFGLFSPREYYRHHRLPIALLGGALFAFGLNALLDHMDHFYMEAGVLLLILAALPVVLRHPLWIPLAITTLHFQWFYFYLQYRPGFHLGWNFFTPVLVVDVLFLALCAFRWKDVRRIILAPFVKFNAL